MMRLMMLLLLLFHIKGETHVDVKGLRLQFGYRITCDKINLIEGVSIIGCYRQCVNRATCKSFNYSVRNKICELCSNDDSDGIISRSGGYVLSHKRRWEQGLNSSGCQCLDTEVCETQAANTTCRIAECPQPVRPNERALTYGKMRNVASQLLYACPSTDLQLGDGKTTCRTDGHWTPTYMSCTVYVGCFTDMRDLRDFPYGPFNLTGLTMEQCRQECQVQYPAADRFYVGLQYRKFCSCSTAYPRYEKTPETDCNMTCSGDSSQTCGGVWRHSVYQTFQ